MWWNRQRRRSPHVTPARESAPSFLTTPTADPRSHLTSRDIKVAAPRQIDVDYFLSLQCRIVWLEITREEPSVMATWSGGVGLPLLA